jgi:predicted GNAT family acetyltransferase
VSWHTFDDELHAESSIYNEAVAVPPSSSEVVDDVSNHRLVLVSAGLTSELVYRQNGPKLILMHVRVPKALQGRGVAGVLVETAVRWALREGLVVVPWCPYARHWLRNNEELTAGVAIDWCTLPRLRTNQPRP